MFHFLISPNITPLISRTAKGPKELVTFRLSSAYPYSHFKVILKLNTIDIIRIIFTFFLSFKCSFINSTLMRGLRQFIMVSSTCYFPLSLYVFFLIFFMFFKRDDFEKRCYDHCKRLFFIFKFHHYKRLFEQLILSLLNIFIIF